MKRNVREELYEHGLYINQVKDLFLWHFDSNQDAAKYFGVTSRTIDNWHKDLSYPLCAVRLLLVRHRGYLPPTKEWRGFKIRGDVLYTPSGRALSTYDLQELDIRMNPEEQIVEFRRRMNA